MFASDFDLSTWSAYQGWKRMTGIAHILIDLDGVLADFVTAALDVQGLPNVVVDRWEMHECCGLTASDFWGTIDRQGYEFWANIDPYPWKDELLALLPTTFTVSTTPSRHPNCAAGKTAWMHQHFRGTNGKVFRDYLIGEHKHLLAAPGRVLIDDSDKNCVKFCEHGGEAILFPQPWNKNRELVGDRLGYVRERLSEIGRAR